MTRKSIVAVAMAVVAGALAGQLVQWGNPGNMGICGACFVRDVAGALGLHSAAKVQYLRPEVFGVMVGAFIAALAFGELRFRGGSAAFVRFVLGAWIAIGALVFLGCPIRALLRLAGGDANALVGLAGLVAGIFLGVRYVKSGFSLGRSPVQPAVGSYLWLIAAIFLLAAVAWRMAGFRFSSEGPGSMHAQWYLSAFAGMIAGFLFQRIRFCSVAAFRDPIFFRDWLPLFLALGLVAGCAIVNMTNGKFAWGFSGQPIAHTNHFWNFSSMVLVGVACVFAGGCPVRHMVLCGEGSQDSMVVLLGMLTGAALAHNFQWVSSPDGITAAAPLVVVVGLLVCGLIGIFMRDAAQAGA